MYQKIYDIVKTNYLSIFGEANAHMFADVFYIKCANRIAKLHVKSKVKIEKTAKYNLSTDNAGLYTKDKNDVAFVVAGGSSLKDFDFSSLKDKTTFVSNKSIFDVPDADYFITTDYTFLTFLKKTHRYDDWKNTTAEKYFVVNFMSDQIQRIDGQIVDVKNHLNYELQDIDNIVICKSAKDVGFDFEHFNSGYNSGFCSLQLALIMGYKKIYLLGVDLNCDGDDTHYHGGYGKSSFKMNQNLRGYGKHFIEVVKKLKRERPDIEIISCSKTSILNDFITYQDIKEIL